MSVELYHRNIDALRRHLPPATLEKIDRPVTFPALVPEEDGGDINIDLGHTRLYAGGAGAYAKIEAARRLGLPVLMIDRPQMPPRHETHEIAQVMEWLAHAGTDLGV